MDKRTTLKLCWSCDGEVNNQSVQCPYCGSHLGTNQEDSVLNSHKEDTCMTNEDNQSQPKFQQVERVASSQDSFTPLYSQTNSSAEQHQEQVYKQETPQNSFSQEGDLESRDSVARENSELESSGSVKEVLAFSLLLTAMGLFLFSVILFLFSKDGYLVLKWKASYWTFCLLLSMPVFYFGWKALNQVEDCEA